MMTKIIKPRAYIRHPAKIFNASAGGGFRKCLFSKPAMTLFLFYKHYIVDKARFAYPYRDCKNGFFRIDI